MNTANGGDILFHFKGDSSNLEKSTKSLTSKMGSMTKSILKATGITKALSTAWNMVTSSMDGAISRVDTLNNFPKVMQNLGIASEEADSSISKMSEALSGLPTTLDQGAMAVQRFTSANGDVKKSTDIFLALNNAILAGGASSEIQASALEQLSQSYAKGKPDMMEWRTAMTAMPAQLKQVAKAMGYVNADELGTDLREGAVSMDEFMDAIIQLNSEGIDGLANFEEQARSATGGIKTSITVAKTQVVKGVAEIIKALNTRLGESGTGITSIISNFGNGIKKGLVEVSKVITGEMSLEEFVTKGIDIVVNIATGMSEGLPQLIPKVAEIITNLVDTLTSEENLGKVISGATTIIENLATGLINAMPIIVEKVPTIINNIIDTLTDEKQMEKIYEAGGRLLVALVIGMIKSIPKLIEGVGQIKARLQNEVVHLPQRWLEMGKALVSGLWDGIVSQTGQFGKNLQSWADGIVKKVEKDLKIGSPSKVFRDDIGQWIPKGIAVGITANTDSIYEAMKNIENVALSGLNLDTMLAPHYSPTINVVNNVDMKTDPLGQVVANIKTFSNGAKNDYNYGMGV